MATVLVDYSVSVQPGDLVQIAGSPLVAPLIEAIYKSVLLRGAHPYVTLDLPGLLGLLFTHANEEQLKHVSVLDELFVDRFNARIFIYCQANTKSLSNVDPAKQVVRKAAHRQLRDRFLHKISSGAQRVCWAMFPTSAYAQDAEMSLREFEELVYRACLVDREDPIEAWRDAEREQEKIVQYLAGKREMRLLAPDTDLRFSVAGRPFIACAAKQNFPDGEIFTCPVEDSAEGHVAFSCPASEEGKEMTGIRLWFKGGRVVREKSDKHEDFLSEVLDTDEGSRVLGEFAFGTNEGVTHCTKNMMLDEKMAGTVHLALGHGYPEAGGTNKSSLHWDLVCDLREGGAVYADGELFYKDGHFIIKFPKAGQKGTQCH